jgi:methyl-accepting chemotaxis protein
MRFVQARTAIVLASLASLALLTAAVAVSTDRVTADRLGRAMKREAIAYAQAASLQVDRAMHARATQARSWSDPDYRAIETELRALRDAWRASGVPVRFVFTVTPDRGARSGMAYVVDAAEEGPDKSKPGEEMRFFERDGDPVDWHRPTAFAYTDAYGSFFSGFAPVHGEDDTVEFVVGIDLDATAVEREATAAGLAAVWPVAASGLVLVAVFGVLVQRALAPVTALEAIARRAAGAAAGSGAQTLPESLEASLASLRTSLDRASQGARHAAESCGKVASRLAERTPEARMVAERCEESSRRMRSAAERARSIAADARESEESARGAADCGANALGEVAHIDAGVQAVIVRGRDLSEHLEEMRRRAATVDAALEAMVVVANRSSVLSLNAEIEASQAGEAGRGFAVVAREIRRLAEQAAQNSLEIERNVRALHDAVEAGRRATTEFGNAANEASARSARLSAAMAEGIQRIQAIAPGVHALGERGDALRREAEEAAEAMRAAHDSAASVAAFLEQARPVLEELRTLSERNAQAAAGG